jgi:virginiamycin B lyase
MSSMRALAGMLVVLLALAASFTYGADPVIDEWPLPEGTRLEDIAAAPDGTICVLAQHLKHKVFRITPKGEISQFQLPNKLGGPRRIAAGGDGMYLTNISDPSIWHMSADGKFEERARVLSKATRPNPSNLGGAWPHGIVADGEVWFTELEADKIGKLGRDGKVIEYPTPSRECGPSSIIVGPDKKIWFIEMSACKIGQLDPATGKIDEFEVPTRRTECYGLCAGPDGAIWFTEYRAGKIGRITVDGKFTEFPLPKGAKPAGITLGGDKNLWFTDPQAGKVCRITPQGQVTAFDLPTKNARPWWCCTAPDGNVWVSEGVGRVARVNVKGEKQ